jgi:hypothetical protein
MSVDFRSLHLAVRLRRLLARRPWIRWLVIATCAATAGIGLQGKVAALNEAKDRWDGGALVYVLRHDVVAGSEIRREDVEQRLVAPDLVPLGAATSFGEPVTTHVGQAVGPAGLLRPGAVGVAVPLPIGSSVPLALGDRVGLVVGSDPLGTGADPTPVGVAAMGEVVFVSSESAVVGLDAAEAAEVASAAAGGRVTVILLGAPVDTVRSTE